MTSIEERYLHRIDFLKLELDALYAEKRIAASGAEREHIDKLIVGMQSEISKTRDELREFLKE